DCADPLVLPSFPTRRSSDLSRLDRLDIGGDACLGVNPAHRDIDHSLKLIVVETAIAVETDRGNLSSLGHLRLRLGNPQDQRRIRSEEHTSELQSRENLVCRL